MRAFLAGALGCDQVRLVAFSMSLGPLLSEAPCLSYPVVFAFFSPYTDAAGRDALME